MVSILKAQREVDGLGARLFGNSSLEQSKLRRESSNGKIESRRMGMLGGFIASSPVIAGVMVGAVTTVAPLVVIPAAVAVGVYFAHQLAPFRDEMANSLKQKLNISAQANPFKKAFDGFKSAFSSLGDKLSAKSAAKDMKMDAQYIREKLGIDKNVKGVLNNHYEKKDHHYLNNQAIRVNKGIDTAIRHKLAQKDHSPLSYSDIERGILMNSEKAGNLANSVEQSKGTDTSIKDVFNKIAMLNTDDLSVSESPNSIMSILKERDKENAKDNKKSHDGTPGMGR